MQNGQEQNNKEKSIIWGAARDRVLLLSQDNPGYNCLICFFPASFAFSKIVALLGTMMSSHTKHSFTGWNVLLLYQIHLNIFFWDISKLSPQFHQLFFVQILV
jgi:hypothetical protein